MFSFNFYDDPVEQMEESMDVDEPEVMSIKLEDILSQLPDTLAYSMLAGLPRRELWHVKMQIMQTNDNEHLLGDSDVIRGSYEGGLKTWECSVDLAEYLSQHPFQGHSVLELGCGSALPTAALFSRALSEKRRCKFVLQDYNNIFNLVTVPNLFLTWYVTEHELSDEFTVTADLKSRFLAKLKEIGIEFEFLVGAWGDNLIKHLGKYDLILSSEGIYSPSSLPQFLSVLVTCFGVYALVASKKIYFGVGGGVTEFLDGLAKLDFIGRDVWEGGQVGRVIIRIDPNRFPIG